MILLDVYAYMNCHHAQRNAKNILVMFITRKVQIDDNLPIVISMDVGITYARILELIYRL